MIRAPRLLVPWESRWQSFKTGIRPALTRSKPRWSGECSLAHSNLRSTVASGLLHAALIAVVAQGAFKSAAPQAQATLFPENASIVYFSGSLPPIDDAVGAKPGKSAAQGGRAIQRPDQEIKVSNEAEPAASIVQVSHLNLPRKVESTTNLLALTAEEAPASVAVDTKLPQLKADPVLPIAPAPESAFQSLKHIKTPEMKDQVVPPPADVQLLQQVKLPDARIQVVPPPLEIPISKTTNLSRLTIPDDLTPVALPPFAEHKRPTPQAISDVAPVEIASNRDSETLNELMQTPGLSKVTLAKPSSAPPANGVPSGATKAGNRASEFVISAKVGSELGLPDQAKLGSGHFSPAGGTAPGLGERGTGKGSSEGPGEGSAVNTSKGPGGAARGTGPRFPSQATRGNSPEAGKGGSGNGTQNAGVTIRGNTFQIASFAEPAPPTASIERPYGPRKAPSVTIIASPRSGGAVNRYGALSGGKVYTIYLDTQAGMATLEFANPKGTTQGSFDAELTAPEPITTDLPLALRGVSILLQCKMDREGVMHGFRILEAVENRLTPAIIAALENWRFRPVLQNGESVEVDAIIGLNVRTH